MENKLQFNDNQNLIRCKLLDHKENIKLVFNQSDENLLVDKLNNRNIFNVNNKIGNGLNYYLNKNKNLNKSKRIDSTEIDQSIDLNNSTEINKAFAKFNLPAYPTVPSLSSLLSSHLLN